MRIIVSGQDRTADLGADIRRAGHLLRHGDPAQELTPEIRLLAWQQTRTQEEYEIWVKRCLQIGSSSEAVEAPPSQRPGALSVYALRLRVLGRKLSRGWLHGNRPPDVSSEIGALSLRNATSEADFTARLIRLMKYRDNSDSKPFLMPRSPGKKGAVMARLRMEMWRILRFQTDRIAFRQNQINTMLTRALEFEHEERLRDTAALQQRVAELEARLKAQHGS